MTDDLRAVRAVKAGAWGDPSMCGAVPPLDNDRRGGILPSVTEENREDDVQIDDLVQGTVDPPMGS